MQRVREKYAITSIRARARWRYENFDAQTCVVDRDNIIFRALFRICRAHLSSSKSGVNHFYEPREIQREAAPLLPLIRFIYVTKRADPRCFIRHGIVKLIGAPRRCQKRYAIGYRVWFNRRNTTTIDTRRAIFRYIEHVANSWRTQIVNRRNTFTKLRCVLTFLFIFI